MDERPAHRADPDSSVDLMDGGPSCGRCRNMRFIYNELTSALVACPDCADAMQQVRAKQEELQAKLKPANALDHYGSDLGRALDQTLFNFVTTLEGKENRILLACQQAAIQFAEELQGWLVIYGRSGNGKSHLAAGVRSLVVHASRIPVIYVTVPDLLYKLRPSFHRDPLNEVNNFEEMLDIYRKCPLIILDDLGSERVSEWASETLFSILDYRYRLRLPTMITTNLDPNNPKLFDPRLVTRMTDKALCVVLENAASNYRSIERETKI